MLYFVTENKEKLSNSRIILKPFHIELEGKTLPIVEIQSHSLEEIALDKARQAFEIIKQPLVVKDDGWHIAALNGFPGSYMKYMNEYLSPEDFLNLLKPYKDREVIFEDALCYIDKKTKKVFTNRIKGHIVDKPKGIGVASARLSTFRKDGKTMAECINEGIHFVDGDNSVWTKFGNWYVNKD